MEEDLTNKKFGNLLVLRRTEPKWLCRCDCGRLVERSTRTLLSRNGMCCSECAGTSTATFYLTSEEITARIKAGLEASKTKKKCKECGKTFIGYPHRKYCSHACAKVFKQRTQSERRKEERERDRRQKQALQNS